MDNQYKINFTMAQVNRPVFPKKHILVVEDNLLCQNDIAAHFNDIFEKEGQVIVSYVSNAITAAPILLGKVPIHLILLDHDLQWGNGSELLEMMQNMNIKIPVITFSGHPYNNEKMVKAGADYGYQKQEVINGDADHIIKRIINKEQ